MGIVKHTPVDRGALFTTIQFRHFDVPTSEGRFVCKKAILAEPARPLSSQKVEDWR